jgi:O-antigen/teichoic acid export membrane protein
MMVLARIYSRSDYGLISYTISVGTLASTFVAAGFPASLVRFLSRYSDDQNKIDIYFSNILTVTLGILMLVCAAVAVIYRLDVGIISIVIGYSVVYIYFGIIRGFIDYLYVFSSP